MLKQTVLIFLFIVGSVFTQLGAPGAPGGIMDIDTEDSSIRSTLYDLAQYGADKIAMQRMSNMSRPITGDKALNYSIIRVVSARTQVVAGMNYFMQVRMKDAKCQQDCDVELCDLVIYVRPWEDYKELSNFKCTKLGIQRPLGSPVEIEKNDPDALRALDFGIKALNEKSNDLYTQKLVKLNKVYKQIVAGWNFSFNFTVGRSNCTKNAPVLSSSKCVVAQNAKLTDCNLEVWDQPWLGQSRYKLTKSSC